MTIATFQFKPAPLTVAAGATVTWTNQDDILHLVASGSPGAPTAAFNGSLDGPGKTFSFTFDKPGSYPYFCSRHEGMRGEVDVT